MAKPKEPRNPFDPSNGPPRSSFAISDMDFGKIEMTGRLDPRSMEREYQMRNEREDFQVRGCGDPSCAQCNPELAARMRRGNIDASAIRRAMERFIGVGSRGGFSIGGPIASITAPSEPENDELEAAREKVEAWLVEMNGDEQGFDDIVGNDDALSQLRDAIRAPVEHKELYEAYRMKMPKGAMLYGPPGCGKTMFARAAAAEMAKLYSDKADVELISLSGSELQSPYVGVTEGHIKAIFTYARLYKEATGHPLLVFIDEAEVLFPDRTGRVRRVASWEESHVATFLAEMDGLSESGAFVLLATNRPEVIDQALLRDGRCDFKIKVERPTREAVEVILQRNFRGVLAATDETDLVFAALEMLYDPHKVILDFHAIVESLEGWLKAQNITVDSPHLQKLKHRNFLLEHVVSGAMAAAVPSRAKRYAFARDKTEGVAHGVTQDDVIKAVADVFSENRGMDHSYALGEFQQGVIAEVEADLKNHARGGQIRA